MRRTILDLGIIALALATSMALATDGNAAILRVPGDFNSLDNAVAAAADGDTVRVAGNGGSTYRARPVIGRPILLEGGWRADFAIRDPSLYVSVVRPPADAFEFERSVFVAQNAGNVIIDGFTIIGGRTGIESISSNLVVRDCVIRGQRGNTSTNPLFNRAGGSMRVVGGTLSLERSVLRDAVCIFGGAGIAIAGASQVTITDSKISNHLSVLANIDGSGACIRCDDTGMLRLERTTVERGANASDAGLVLVRNTPFVAEDCVFSQGTSSVNAGGIRLFECPLVQIARCVIEDCSSNSRGGGLDVEQCGSFALTECTIQRNVTRLDGAGLYLVNTPFVMTDNRFEANNRTTFPIALTVRGGGVRAISSTGTVTRTCFVREISSAYGGGWSQAGGDVTFNDCVFDGNSSTLYGGAFFLDLSGTARFSKSLIRGCSAKFGGGVSVAFAAKLFADQCTFVENSAISTGAAVYVETGASAEVTSSLVCRATRGDLVSCANGEITFVATNTWNDASLNPREEFGGICVDPAGTNGNLSVDPLFCVLPGAPPFCDSGTIAYSLQSDSPCLAAGVGGVDMGWRGSACTPGPRLDLESQTWGRIKSLYRTP